MAQLLEKGIVVVYFLIVLGIGYYFKDRRSADEFWTAGGEIGTFVNTIALFVAVASGGTFLGFLGIAYSLGVPFAWSAIIGAAPAFAIGGILLAKPLRRVDRYTLSDLFDFLYEDKRINTLVPILIVFGFFFYSVAQLKAAGFTMRYLLDINYIPAVTIAGLIFVAYVALGGMWAITITDFLQGMLMWVLMLIIAGFSLAYFDFSSIAPLNQVPQIAATAPLPIESWIGFTILNGVGIVVFPHIIMRVFSSESPQSARRAYSWMGLLYAVFTIVSFYIIGATALSIAPNLSDPDLALIAVMEGLLPPFVGGLTAAAILAAVMSSTDAFLLALAAAVSNDLYKQVINSDASESRVVRLGTVSAIVLGLGAIVAAWNPPTLLVQLYLDAIGVWNPAFFFPMILEIWWKRMNRHGALAGMILSTLAYAAGYFTLGSFVYVMPGMAACLVGCIGGSLLTSPRGREEIQRLSEKLGHERVGWPLNLYFAS